MVILFSYSCYHTTKFLSLDLSGHHQLRILIASIAIGSAQNNDSMCKPPRHKIFWQCFTLSPEAAEERAGFAGPETLHVLKAGVS